MKFEIPNVRVRVERANTSEDTVMDEVFVTGTNPHQNHVLHLQGELAGILESGTYTLQFIKDKPAEVAEDSASKSESSVALKLGEIAN